MGNQILIRGVFVANVERCTIGYDIRRVFTPPKADIPQYHIRFAYIKAA